MKHRNVVLSICAIGVLVAGLSMMAAGRASGECGACGAGGAEGSVAKAVVAGTGHSDSKDPAAAGAEAAGKAKAALGNQKAKVVLVFDSDEIGSKPADKQKVLDAVAAVFDASIIYGCSAYNSITEASNYATVGVVALGGKVRADACLAKLEGKDHAGCGKAIGEGIKPAVEKAGGKGKVLILIGDCHVPANDKLVKGVCGVLGEKFPVAGGAAKGGLTYCKGKVVRKSNLGLLLSGDFQCGFSAKQAPGGTPKPMEVVNATAEAFKQAVGDNRNRVLVALAFDCGGRRGQMGKERPKELAGMKKVVGKAPIIGFYGSGETGPASTGAAPRGVGYHIIAVALLAK